MQKRILSLLLIAGIAEAQDYGAFVAKEGDETKPRKAYLLANAPNTRTNACADYVDLRGSPVKMYRILVTESEYAAGWEALSQARKDAAKAAAQAERTDFTKFDAKLIASVRALVKTINLRLPAGQKITEAELKAAIKEEL